MSSSTPTPTPHYLKSEPQASTSLRLLANALNGTAYKSFLFPKINSPPHIGFDLEWKPNYRPGEVENPIAVIQIAYQDASYVIHISWMKAIPDGLAEILENPRIVKVGVGIQYDAKKLFKDLGISLNSCVDLSLFVKCVDYGLFAERLDRYADIPLSLQTSTVIPDPPSPSSPREILTAYYSSEAFLGPHIHRSFRGSYNTSIGLARLAEMYTGIVLTKGKVTRSNWEAVLTEAQLTYAALDAYAGYIVYAHLVNLFNLLSQKPMRRFYAFDCIRGTLYHCSGDTSRTLPAQLIEGSNMDSSPVFRPVGDEISLHIQGIGEDQPRGLVPWTQSNPEYDAGPMPPPKTEEEKEAAKIARQKKKEGKQIQKEEDGKKSIVPNTKPQQQQLRSGYDATRSGTASVAASTQTSKMVQPPRAQRISRGYVPPSERTTSVATSTWSRGYVPPSERTTSITTSTWSRGYVPPSERIASVTTSAQATKVVQPPRALTVSRAYIPPSERITSVTQATNMVQPPVYIPPSERQGRSEVMVMTTAGATASPGVSKPPGKNKQKRPQTKPRPGPNTVSQSSTSGISSVSPSTPAPKKKGKKSFKSQALSKGQLGGELSG